MNKVLLFFLEWLGAFVVIFGLNYGAKWLLSKRYNPVTTAIFAFVSVGFLVFITAHYFISSVDPAIIFLPFLILFLILDLRKANNDMK